jgi:ABC-type phosphate transport system substrate-binding protein
MNVTLCHLISSERVKRSPKKGTFTFFKEKLMSWIKKVTVGKSHEFQQDGKSAHISHLVQNRHSDNMEIFWPKEFWPPK